MAEQAESIENDETNAGVTVLSGVGTQKAKLLKKAGIESLKQLAEADAEELQQKVDSAAEEENSSSVKKVEQYIRSARVRLGLEKPREEKQHSSRKDESKRDVSEYVHETDPEAAIAAGQSSRRQRKAPSRYRPTQGKHAEEDKEQDDAENEVDGKDDRGEKRYRSTDEDEANKKAMKRSEETAEHTSAGVDAQEEPGQPDGKHNSVHHEDREEE